MAAGSFSLTRRGLSLLLASALSLAFQTGAHATDPPGNVVEQRWTLLGEPAAASTASTIDLSRGTIPGGTTGFDPVPEATLALVGVVSGGPTTSDWRITLRSGSQTLTSVVFASSDTGATLRTAGIAWPSVDVGLDALDVRPEGSRPPGGVELKAVWVSFVQRGVILKTVGRLSLAHSEVVSSTSYSAMLDDAPYLHNLSSFDPAPSAALRFTATLINPSSRGNVRLLSVGGVEAARTIVDPGQRQYSAVAALTTNTWRIQASVWYAGATMSVDSADLVFNQVAPDGRGIRKTVAWQQLVSAGRDLAAGQQIAGQVPAPTLAAEAATATWTGALKSNVSAVGALLTSGTSNAEISTSSASFVEISVPWVSAPAGAGMTVRSTPLGGVGRLSRAEVRVMLTLWQFTGPVISGFHATPEYLSPEGDGVQDGTVLQATLYGVIAGWTLGVRDSSAAAVRAWSGTGSSAVVAWDGRDAAGSVVADGIYRARLEATDGSSAVTSEVGVGVDTADPVISGWDASHGYLSPNADGVKEYITFPGTFSDVSPATAVLVVRDAEGLEVYRSMGGTHSFPTWDGRKFSGGAVADGVFQAEAVVTDAAGNSSSATRPVTVDRVSPEVGTSGVFPRWFSPNDDGVRDQMTFFGQIEDATPTSWELRIATAGGTLLRTIEGTDASIEQVWNGLRNDGSTAPDGDHAGRFFATDAAGNESYSYNESVTVDTVAPVATDITPRDAVTTLDARPETLVTVQEMGSGVSDSSSATIDDVAASVWLVPEGLRVAPTADLGPDTSHPLRITLQDRAGNRTILPERILHRMSVGQTPLVAEVTTRTAVVPTAEQCLTSCSVTFPNVSVNVGEHSFTMNSSGHTGVGDIRRPIPLNLIVEWTHLNGSTGAGWVPHGSPVAVYELFSDDAYTTPLTVPVLAESLDLGDITVEVPASVKPGSVAKLSMAPETQQPGCATTASAPDPRDCDVVVDAAGEPLTRPLPEPTLPVGGEFGEDNCDATCDAYLASVTISGVRVTLPEEGLTQEVPAPDGNGDTSWEDWSAGAIVVKVRAGQDVLTVAADHGSTPSDVAQGLPGPFDDIDIDVGLDRWYNIQVPMGTEKVKVLEWVTDARVEYVHLSPPNDVVPLAVPSDPGVSASCPGGSLAWCGKQWHLSMGTNKTWKEHGIWPLGAWVRADGRFLGTRRIETAYVDSGFTDTHEDLASKIVPGYAFPDGSANNDNYKDCYGETRNFMAQHGTWVMGMNAQTDNARGVAGVNHSGYAIPIQWGVRPSSAGTDPCQPIANESRRAAHIKKGVDLGAEVVNISYGSPTPAPAECEAIYAAYRKGVIVVTAQPYGGAASAVWPSLCRTNVDEKVYKYQLVVTATDTDGKIWAGAWGQTPNVDKDELALADLAAPGVKIRSTGRAGSTCCTGNAAYDQVPVSGTSVASPQVAGLVHLLTQIGAPRYAARNAPRASATRAGANCDGSGESCFGKINMSRAVGSAVKNGVFEVWSDATHASSWSRRRNCSSQQTQKGPDASPGSHGHSLLTACRTGPPNPGTVAALTMTSTVQVTPGWRYRLDVRAKRDADNTSATSAEVIICFYKKDPTDPASPAGSSANPATCRSDLSDATVLKQGVWSGWSFDPGIDAPANHPWAQVQLRTWPTSAGTVSWDDVGFYAIAP